jgi:hypothetical protein
MGGRRAKIIFNSNARTLKTDAAEARRQNAHRIGRFRNDDAGRRLLQYPA